MRAIKAKEIHDAVVDLVLTAARYLPEDVKQAFADARDKEESESAREILTQLLDNADLAASSGLPLCQDTGVGIFFVEMGDQVHVEGNITEILNNAMVEGYEKGLLRKSLCHPLTRANTKDNSPAVVHIDIVSGDKLTIKHMAKGGGSENMSRCTMLTPAQGWQGITCNAVCPGYVKTPLVEGQIASQAKERGITMEEVVRDVLLGAQPTKKFTTVEDLGALVAFLSSDAAQNITGAIIPADGGWTAH